MFDSGVALVFYQEDRKRMLYMIGSGRQGFRMEELLSPIYLEGRVPSLSDTLEAMDKLQRDLSDGVVHLAEAETLVQIDYVQRIIATKEPFLWEVAAVEMAWSSSNEWNELIQKYRGFHENQQKLERKGWKFYYSQKYPLERGELYREGLMERVLKGRIPEFAIQVDTSWVLIVEGRFLSNGLELPEELLMLWKLGEWSEFRRLLFQLRGESCV